MSTRRTFQARFREAFDALGISQAQFARDVGMTRANVTHWLSGRGKKPSGEKAARAAQRLRVNLGWLLGEEVLKEPSGSIAAIGKISEGGIVVEPAQEIQGMEFTKEALEVARAFMKLPEKLRVQYKRSIETEALNWAAEASDERVAAKLPASPASKRSGGTIGKTLGSLIVAIGLFVIDCYDEPAYAKPDDNPSLYICAAEGRVVSGWKACQARPPEAIRKPPRAAYAEPVRNGGRPDPSWEAQCEGYFAGDRRAIEVCKGSQQ